VWAGVLASLAGVRTGLIAGNVIKPGNDTVGPGTYTSGFKKSSNIKAPQYSMRARTQDTWRNANPGPGTYEDNDPQPRGTKI
jgi:hypothetical protein